MSAHTKGPWIVDREYTDRGARVVVIRNDGFEYAADEHGVNEEDAWLIAAAPELLSSVEALLGLFQKAVASGDWVVDGACDPDAAINRARAAIAKATQP